MFTLLLAAAVSAIAALQAPQFSGPTAKPSEILTVLNATSKTTKWQQYDAKNVKQAAYYKMSGAVDMIVGGDCYITIYPSAQDAFNALSETGGSFGDAWFYPGEFKSLGTALGVLGKDETCANEATSAMKLFTRNFGANNPEPYWTPTLAQIDMCLSHHLGCIAHYSLAVPNNISALHNPNAGLLQKLIDAGICYSMTPGTKAVDSAVNSCEYGSDKDGNPYQLSLYASDLSVFYDVIGTGKYGGSRHLLADDGWTLHPQNHDDYRILAKAKKVIGGRLILRPVVKVYKPSPKAKP
jgi:hypothetical protein